MKNHLFFITKPKLYSVILIGILLFIIGNIVTTQKKNIHTEYESVINNYYQKTLKAPREKLKEIPKPDQPDFAALQNFISTMDPGLKLIPATRLYNAYKKQKKQQQQKNFTALQWEEQVANIGGRSRSLMFDPNDTTGMKVWAGSVTGGLWYTNDIYHAEWTAVNDFWENLSVSCMVADPLNPQTFYVGTGEGETAVLVYRASSGLGIGIWKSTDAGNTWQLLESTIGFEYVNDIKIRIENGNSVIYAGVISGLYQGEYHNSQPTDGLYRSTDNGETWTQVLPDIPNLNVPYSPSDIAVVADTGRIFVGTAPNTSKKGGATILYSDDGLNWTVFDDYRTQIENSSFYLPGRVMLAPAPSNSDVIYAIIASGQEGAFLSFDMYYGNYILRSNNNGLTWSETNIPNSGDNWAYLAWHALSIAVDPNNENTIVVGGLDLHKSTDAGQSWEKISSWYNYNPQSSYLPPYVHADQHTILYYKHSSDTAIFSNDGGVFLSLNMSNDNPNFIESNRNYNTLQYYACALHPDSATNYFLAGAQDNGTFRYKGETISLSDQVSGGDGGYCFIDEIEPNIQISSSQFDVIYISTDGNHENINYYDPELGIFINPCDYNSSEKTLYANAMTFYGDFSDKLARIKNIGSYINYDMVSLSTGTTVPYSNIKLSPFSPEDSTTIFIGTQSGRLFKVENANDNPAVTELTGNDFPAASISGIDVGQSENNLIVCFSNYGVNSIWSSTDGGETWLSKEGNLPDIPVRWVIFHPQNQRMAMIATELGVWTTDDLKPDSVIWEQAVNGFSNVRVDMLKIRKSDNTVVAATHGRGLFKAIYTDISPDAGILTINSPISGNDFTNSELINVTVKNFGPVSISNFAVSYQINDGEIVTDTITENLSSNETIDFTFGSYADLSAHLIYNLKVWTTLENDTHDLNDTLNVIIDNSSAVNELFVSELTFFPNPNNGNMNIRFKSESNNNLNIKIFDVSGKIVYDEIVNNSKGIINKKIHYKSVQGINFLQITDGNKYLTRKIIYVED